MRNRQIVSVLEKVCKDVWKATTVKKAKECVEECLTKSNINEEDKNSMLTKMRGFNDNDLVKLKQYFANCILKYEGYGVLK